MTTTSTWPQTLTRVQQVTQQAKENQDSLDMALVNVLAHARRYWGVNWTWEGLLSRVESMCDPSQNPDEMWDLQMMKLAAGHPDLDPVAHQTHGQDLPYMRRRFERFFDALWLERACRQGRAHFLTQLRAVLASTSRAR